MMERRAFISGLISLVAAPAIIKYSNLMPVKVHPFGLAGDGVALYSIPHPSYNDALFASMRETFERAYVDMLSITGVETILLDPAKMQTRGLRIT